MKDEELQALHDEIWREIYARQRRTLELKKMTEQCNSNASDHNCGSQLEKESARSDIFLKQ